MSDDHQPTEPEPRESQAATAPGQPDSLPPDTADSAPQEARILIL